LLILVVSHGLLVLFHLRLGIHFLSRVVEIPQRHKAALWCHDAPDAHATKRTRSPAVIEPNPHALLAKQVMVARKEEDAGLFWDFFQANGAWRFREVFCGSVSGKKWCGGGVAYQKMGYPHPLHSWHAISVRKSHGVLVT
jgi:hypothetical protein